MYKVDKCVFGIVCLILIFLSLFMPIGQLKHVFAVLFIVSCLLSASLDLKRAYPWMLLCVVSLLLGVFLPEQ